MPSWVSWGWACGPPRVAVWSPSRSVGPLTFQVELGAPACLSAPLSGCSQVLKLLSGPRQSLKPEGWMVSGLDSALLPVEPGLAQTQALSLLVWGMYLCIVCWFLLRARSRRCSVLAQCPDHPPPPPPAAGLLSGRCSPGILPLVSKGLGS